MKKQQPEELARRRAEIILKVQAGEITASEAARELSISRKTYYKWEQRGLAAMLDGLSDREPGRPTHPPDPEIERLRSRVEELERQLRRSRHRDQLRDLLREAEKKE